MNIYIGNLSRTVTEEQLRTAFEAFGIVTTAKVIKDKFTGEPRGFGFVEMPEKEQAEQALAELNGSELGGQRIRVNEARPPQQRTGGPRGPRGGGFRNDRGGDRGGRRF